MSRRGGAGKFWRCVGALLLPIIIGGIVMTIFMYNTPTTGNSGLREGTMGLIFGASFITGILLLINNISEARGLEGGGYVFFMIFSTLGVGLGILSLIWQPTNDFYFFVKFTTLPYFLSLITTLYFDNGEGQFYDELFNLGVYPILRSLFFMIVCSIVAAINLLAGYITTGVLSGIMLFAIIFSTIRLGIPNGQWYKNEEYNAFQSFVTKFFAPLGLIVKSFEGAQSKSSSDSSEYEAEDAFRSAVENYGYYHFNCYSVDATRIGSTIYVEAIINNYGNEPRSIIENALRSGVSAAKSSTGYSIKLKYTIKN